MRVVVAGTSGSGKSTAARRIAKRFDLPYVEIDALFHGPDWVPRPRFQADVEAFTAGDRWVIEWQYGQVRALLVERADTLVWLDYPRWLVMQRLVRRTVSRRVHRTVLWNGNRELPLRTFLTDPEHVVRWAWTTHHKRQRQVQDVIAKSPRLRVVHCRHPRDLDRWLRHDA